VEQLYITLATSISAVGDITQYQIVHSLVTLLPLPISYFFFQYGAPPYVLYVSFLFYSIIIFAITVWYAKKTFNLPVRVFLNDVVLRGALMFFIGMIVAAIPYMYFSAGLFRLTVVSIFSTATIFILFWLVGLCEYERVVARRIVNATKQRIMSLLAE
jgi:hypothetical protein